MVASGWMEVLLYLSYIFQNDQALQSLYGYEPLKWKDLTTKQARVALVNDHLEENQKVSQILKEVT